MKKNLFPIVMIGVLVLAILAVEFMVYNNHDKVNPTTDSTVVKVDTNIVVNDTVKVDTCK